MRTRRARPRGALSSFPDAHTAQDYSKGSYYNNPLYDDPFQDPELAKKVCARAGGGEGVRASELT